MNTTEALLNLDLAVGVSAAVAATMFVVPNIDRIRLFRRALTRRPTRLTQRRFATRDLGRS
jgi:hypothetical protein